MSRQRTYLVYTIELIRRNDASPNSFQLNKKLSKIKYKKSLNQMHIQFSW